MVQAVTWKIKDLINYDVANAVVDSYPMPVSSKNKQQLVGAVVAHETVVSHYAQAINSTAMKLVALDIHQLVQLNLADIQQNTKQTLCPGRATRVTE